MVTGCLHVGGSCCQQAGFASPSTMRASERHLLTSAYMRLYDRVIPVCQLDEDSTMPVDAAMSFGACNCLAVRSAARHVTQFYDQVLAPTGLRITQFTILANLREKGPSTINALAEDIVMDRTTLGRNILPLERDGLIRIEQAENDRRAKELYLTKAGEKRLQAAAEKWSKAQAQFETTFGRKRSADLRSMLQAAVTTDFEAPRPGTRPIPWATR
jgi:DNA-binding MarR family transcriptional regulator